MMNKIDAELLKQHLEEIRKIRDRQPSGDPRYLLNAACDRLHVAISQPPTN
jgi:hypothetical protein